jgi:hypothetical protein
MELVLSMNSGGINAEIDYGTMVGGKTPRGCPLIVVAPATFSSAFLSLFFFVFVFFIFGFCVRCVHSALQSHDQKLSLCSIHLLLEMLRIVDVECQSDRWLFCLNPERLAGSCTRYCLNLQRLAARELRMLVPRSASSCVVALNAIIA